MKSLTAFLVGCLVTASSLIAVDTAPWTVRGNLERSQFLVQAHRGAGELSEENTPEAFELGWKHGCVPEADVRTTSDDVIVAFHDANFNRVVRNLPPELKGKGVKDITFAELQKLDVGAWKGDSFNVRKVARMSEMFALLKTNPSRLLYLDIKQVSLKQLAEEVRTAGVSKQVILASTKYPELREWKALLPDSKTLLWMGGTEEALTKRFEELRQTNFADVTQLQIHTNLALPVNQIKRDTPNPFKESDAFLRARGDELRERGILYQTLPWGGSTPDVYWKLLDLGFMSFATDHPIVTQTAIDQFYAGQ